MKTLFVINILLLLTSCGNSLEVKESPISDIQSITPQEESISFETVRSNILKSHCIQCHAGYNEYDIVFADKENILDAVLTGRMPKNAPSLDEELIVLLKSWVDQGAPLDSTVTEPVTAELAATWESLSKKVFLPKCIQCHNPQGQASFLDLSTRQSFFDQRDYLLGNFEDALNSYLVEVITDPNEPMPPSWSNIDRLSQEEVDAIIEWVEKGLP